MALERKKMKKFLGIRNYGKTYKLFTEIYGYFLERFLNIFITTTLKID